MTYTLHRHYDDGLTELEYRADGDGHTVDALIAPYDRPADIDDVLGRYREVFTRATFAGWLQAITRAGAEHRIGLNLDHSAALDHRIGFARSITDSADGIRARFRLYDDPARIDKVRDMLRHSHRGMSIEFRAKRYREQADGVREWIGGQIFDTAATPQGFHADARVLAVRADDGAGLAELGTPRLDAAIARWGMTAAVPSRSNT